MFYATLCGLIIYPLLSAAATGDPANLISALGGVAAALGNSLFAREIANARDKAVGADPANPPEWLRDVQNALATIANQVGKQAETAEKLIAAIETQRNQPDIAAALLTLAKRLNLNEALARQQQSEEHREMIDIFRAEIQQLVAAASPETRRRYLERLRRRLSSLPLEALGEDDDVTLKQVYINLDTTTPAKDEATDKGRSKGASLREDEAPRHLSAMEAFAECPRLLLLGDPGSGKSAFVDMQAVNLASTLLGEGDPPPGIEADLLPVVIALRDLIPRLAVLQDDSSADQQRDACINLFRAQVAEDMQSLLAEGFQDGLLDAVCEGRCLLVLDGLDEVPDRLREKVRDCVRVLMREFTPKRVIITCRVRSKPEEGFFAGFVAHTLAPFDEPRVRQFSLAWYRAQRELGKIGADEVVRRADNLARAAWGDDLRELAAIPMMLTIMAMIHQRDVGLPKERARLYRRAVEVLALRWQRHRAGPVSGPLGDFLRDELRVCATMERLAFEAHDVARRAATGDEPADLPRATALTILEGVRYLGSAGLASEFLDYVDQRAGVLVGRGGEPEKPTAYSFPHRTFQEYLAGRYMMAQRNAGRELLKHASEGDYWGLAVLLGVEDQYYCDTAGVHAALDAAYALCPATAPASDAERTAMLWSAAIAALLGRETIEADVEVSNGGAVYLARIESYLDSLLATERPIRERIEAGNVLGRLGDPRFHAADRYFLPIDPPLGFIDIPAGEFLMGSTREDDPDAYDDELPQHPVTLSAYYIGKYPVTLAHFRAFVEATGFTPGDPDCLTGLANHPVVRVSWDEAMAYCAWLTEQLHNHEHKQDSPLFPPFPMGAWVVTLPTEAQWEKAARWDEQQRQSLRYPWGADWDANRANGGETGIGATSAVGCFPAGRGPYGVEEMSGNVWEWCADRYSADYYQTSPAQDPFGPDGGDTRVLRGGAWYSYSPDIYRAAYRFRGFPGVRNCYLGFRCVLRSPGP